MSIVLVGTLDTKGQEYSWLRDRLHEHGADVLVLDVGILDPPGLLADLDRDAVAAAAGTSVAALRLAGDRGSALRAMAEGASSLVGELHREGRVSGVLAAAGSGGSSVAARVMQALPIGLPKLLVSTMASGDVSPYVGIADVTVMNAVVDVAGLNALSEEILGNAAAGIVAMAAAYEARRREGAGSSHRPVVAATMFGVTTPAVDSARRWLEEHGYEVLVFHATGAGGRTMEALVESGFLAGVLDLTTTELADELVGGVLSAGPTRLQAAAAAGVPQVVSLGALDMVNFGPRETVPPQFEGRNLHVHNDTVTLMRTTGTEMRELGRLVAEKVSASSGPATIFIPLGGVSALDAEGAAFADPEADRECVTALKGALGPGVELIEMPNHINDEEFAVAMAEKLHESIESGKTRSR